MFKAIPEFSLYEMDENKTIRHVKTKSVKSPHRGGDSVRLYTEEGKELSRKIDKLYDLTFPENLPGVVLEPYTKYRVLDDGDIYSMYEAKMLKPASTKDGYQAVSLQVGDTGEYKSELVHRLVAIAYLERDLSKPDVNHKDGDKRNNKASNLEWCDRHENMQHAYDNDLKTPKFRKCKVTKPDGDVLEFDSLKEASDYLEVTTGAVTATVWKNAAGEVPTKGYGRTVGKYTCKGCIVEYNE